MYVLTWYRQVRLALLRPFVFPFTIDSTSSIVPVVPIVPGVFPYNFWLEHVWVHHVNIRFNVETILCHEPLNQSLWVAKSNPLQPQQFVELGKQPVPQPVEPDSEHNKGFTRTGMSSLPGYTVENSGDQDSITQEDEANIEPVSGRDAAVVKQEMCHPVYCQQRIARGECQSFCWHLVRGFYGTKYGSAGPCVSGIEL